MEQNTQFSWKREPKAEALVLEYLSQYLAASPSLQRFERQLLKNTSTRLFDWIDHLVISDAPKLRGQLKEAGFALDSLSKNPAVFAHPRAQLPRVVVEVTSAFMQGVAIKVDRIPDFLMVRGASCPIEGSPLSSYRRSCVFTENQVSFWAVERRLWTTMEPTHLGEKEIQKLLRAAERWQSRPRHFKDEMLGMIETHVIAEELIEDIGQDPAAWVVLECERNYWQSRNTAGQVQKNRQDRMGLGWANHDHHTFRSSRLHFPQLVALFEKLGFHCRERFYAGEEAGWGAQVMENPRSGLVLFLDLDLAPEELEIDFAHEPLKKRKDLGTIGLWCALHGDSIFQAGMHHLEAQFMFDALTEDLKHQGFAMMDPFSNFSYLKQAFTHGEVWPVEKDRVEPLLKAGQISKEEADKFLKYGAVGSHLENLQRREGYKGFNQKNVSEIIQKTDPRKLNV